MRALVNGLVLSGVVLLMPVVATAQQPAPRVKFQVDRIQLSQPVEFDAGKATLTADSQALLDEVAAALAEKPNISRVRVEVHTDNQGNKGANDRLSKARADAVKKYLVGKGVPAKNLEALGLGGARPLFSNDVVESRARNHRVELVLITMGGEAVTVPVAKVVGVEGDLQTTPSDKEPWESAGVGELLADSQWVATGPDSQGRLLMRDTGVVAVEADTLALVRGAANQDPKRPPSQVVLYKGSARTMLMDPRMGQGLVTVKAGVVAVEAAESDVEVKLLEDGGVVVIHRGGAPVQARGKAGKPLTLTVDQKVRATKDGVFGEVTTVPQPPAWDSDAPVVTVALPGSPARPSGALAPGNDGVAWKGRLAQHPEGEPVLGTIEGKGSPVMVDGLRAGLWQVRLRSADAEGDEGPLGPPRLFRVLAVDIPEARSGRPVVFSQGRILTMPEGVTVARGDGAPAQSITLDEPGETTLKVFPAPEAAPVLVAANVIPVAVTVLGGDNRVMEGSERELTLELLGAGPILQPWEIKEAKGVDLLRQEVGRPSSQKSQNLTMLVRGRIPGDATVVVGPPGDGKTRVTVVVNVVGKPRAPVAVKRKPVVREKTGFFTPPAIVLASLGAVAAGAGVLLSPLLVVGAGALLVTVQNHSEPKFQGYALAVMGAGVAGLATLAWGGVLLGSAIVHWALAF